MINKNILHQGALYLFATLLTGLILLWAIQPATFLMHIPISYGGDGLFVATIIKSIMDSHQYVTNPYLGAPFIYNIADYPIYDVFNYIVIRFFALFTKDYAVVVNSYYFATYFFVTWISLFVFQRLGLNKIFSLVASLLFAFIPYHLMRGEGHFWVNIFLATPIYVLLAFDVFEKNKNHYLKTIGYLLLCLLAAASSSAGYFAFFGCYLLVVAGLVGSLDKKTWRPLLKAFMYIAVTGAMILVNLAPDVRDNLRYGHNTEAADRAPFESEIAGLKIMQLVLPVNDHRVHVLRVLKDKYNSTAPLVNENTTATLGIIGSIGFFILLVVLLVRRYADSLPILYRLSILNLMTVLLGTIGGLGSIFAYAVSPTIRSYNRISVYVSFFCLLAFFLALQHYLSKKSFANRKVVYGCVATFLLVFGLLDQVPLHSYFNNIKLQETYLSEDAFIKKIETVMPAGSAIFQLPYASFPESLVVNQLQEDDLARAYLHSHTLRWSYGAMRGRPLTKWQAAVSIKPVPDMLQDLALTGFTGIYIDRKGYVDNGFAIEKALAANLKVNPIISSNERLVFFDMRPYVDHYKKSMSQSAWITKGSDIIFAMNNTYRFQRGFYDLEIGKQGPMQWANSQGELHFSNSQLHAVPIRISFILTGRSSNVTPIHLSGNLIHENIAVNDKGITVTRDLTLTTGQSSIYFTSDVKKRDLSKNINNWYFKISDLSIQPLNSKG